MHIYWIVPSYFSKCILHSLISSYVFSITVCLVLQPPSNMLPADSPDSLALEHPKTVTLEHRTSKRFIGSIMNQHHICFLDCLKVTLYLIFFFLFHSFSFHKKESKLFLLQDNQYCIVNSDTVARLQHQISFCSGRWTIQMIGNIISPHPQPTFSYYQPLSCLPENLQEA